MISYEEALAATDPSLSEDARKESAQRIVDGVTANRIYWNSRSELEALRAQAEGHGVVVRGADEEESPTAIDTSTGQTVEATATEEGTTVLGPGTSGTAPDATPPATDAATPAPTPDNTVEAVARLRAQVQSLGGTPEV